MNLLRALGLVTLPLLAACGQGQKPDPDRLESYAQRWMVEPAGSGAEQRLTLPADALLALKTPDLADLRLFDATGRALPLACLKEGEERSQVTVLPSYPVLSGGAASDTSAGVALVIGPDKKARVVGLAAPPGGERQVATLIDTREVEQRAQAVQLTVKLPLQQAVTFQAAVSSDLKTWESVGEKTLFRTDAAGGQLEAAELPLGGIILKDRYLQITWDKPEGVAVTEAKVVKVFDPARPTLALSTQGARLEGPRDLRFTLPPGHPPDAITVALSGEEGVVPVSMFARANAEQPWRPMIATTLRSAGGAANRLLLDGAAGREFRLVADERTPGFAAVPRISLEYGEVVMLTRFSGKPPYQLAIGLADAPRRLLTPADILPRGNPVALPTARVIGGKLASVDLSPSKDGPLGGRKAVLWLVLAVGVAVLGFAVARLLRKGAAPTDS
jgi:hypothetical protein